MRTRSHVIVALSGVIALAGCATLEESIAEQTAETYHATLTGAQEVGQGDANGTGKAEITISDELDQICWDLNDVSNIGPITAAHVHSGFAGKNGPVVYTLRRSNEGSYKGCTNASEWVGDRIEGNPAAFYVNVHTADYPNGSIRGQLRN